MILLMAKAMEKGPNGIVWSTVQSGLIFPFLMGIVFFNVAVTEKLVSGFVLIAVSVLLYGLSREKPSEESLQTGEHTVGKKQKKHWYFFALCGMLCCGLNQCSNNIPSYFPECAGITSVYKALFCGLGTLSAWTLTSFWKKEIFHLDIRNRQPLKILFYAISMTAVGVTSTYLFLYRGLDLLAKAGVGSVAYPVAVCSCILGFILYTFIFLKERLSKLQVLGLAAGL